MDILVEEKTWTIQLRDTWDECSCVHHSETDAFVAPQKADHIDLFDFVEWLYWGLRAFLHEADLTRIRSLRLKIWRKSAGFSFPWEKVGTGWTEQGMCFMPGAKTSWSPRNHSNINTYCWWNHSIWFTLGSCQENTWQSIYLFTWIELYMGIPLMNFSHCPKKHPCLKSEVVLFRISVQKTWIKPNP